MDVIAAGFRARIHVNLSASTSMTKTESSILNKAKAQVARKRAPAELKLFE